MLYSNPNFEPQIPIDHKNEELIAEVMAQSYSEHPELFESQHNTSISAISNAGESSRMSVEQQKETLKRALDEMQTSIKLSTDPNESVNINEDVVANTKAIFVVSGAGTWNHPNLGEASVHRNEMMDWTTYRRLLKGMQISKQIAFERAGVSYDQRADHVLSKGIIEEFGPEIFFNGLSVQVDSLLNSFNNGEMDFPASKFKYVNNPNIKSTRHQVAQENFLTPEIINELKKKDSKLIITTSSLHTPRVLRMMHNAGDWTKGFEVVPYPVSMPEEFHNQFAFNEAKGLLFYTKMGICAPKADELSPENRHKYSK